MDLAKLKRRIVDKEEGARGVVLILLPLPKTITVYLQLLYPFYAAYRQTLTIQGHVHDDHFRTKQEMGVGRGSWRSERERGKLVSTSTAKT